MEYDFEIEEYFIEAVVDNNLISVREYVELYDIDISYDNNLAIIITAEEGFNEIFDYFLWLDIVDLSFDNYETLKRAIIYNNRYIIMAIINNINLKNINEEWINNNLTNVSHRKILKTILNINYF